MSKIAKFSDNTNWFMLNGEAINSEDICLECNNKLGQTSIVCMKKCKLCGRDKIMTIRAADVQKQLQDINIYNYKIVAMEITLEIAIMFLAFANGWFASQGFMTQSIILQFLVFMIGTFIIIHKFIVCVWKKWCKVIMFDTFNIKLHPNFTVELIPYTDGIIKYINSNELIFVYTYDINSDINFDIKINTDMV